MFVFVSFGIAQEAEEEEEPKLPKEALKALYEAQMLMGEDKFDEAIALLNAYLDKRPPDVPMHIYVMLGNCWYAKENFEETLKAFKKAHELDPTDINALSNYAIMNAQTERFIEAAVLFEKLYDLEDPPKSKNLFQAAACYYQGEDLKNSKRVLERLLRLPGTPEHKWYQLIIEISNALEQMEDVERYILEFLTLDPLQAQYWSLLSQIRLDREDLIIGASDLEIAYRVEAPKRQSQWRNLSDLYLYVHAPLMSVRCQEEAQEGDSDPKGYIRIADAYTRVLRYDEAIKTLDEGLKKKVSADLLFEKGRILYDDMRFRQAIDVFKECVKLDSKRGEAFTLMGFAAWSLKSWDEARTAFADASRIPKFRDQANAAIGALDDVIKQRDDLDDL
jgi:tetratricopeptide (TPR) repeat protein